MQNGYYIYEFWKSKTFETYGLFFNLSDKINLRKSFKYVAFKSFNLLHMEKYKKVIQKQ